MLVTSVFLKLLKVTQGGGGGVCGVKYLSDLKKVLKSLGQMLRVPAFPVTLGVVTVSYLSCLKVSKHGLRTAWGRNLPSGPAFNQHLSLIVWIFQTPEAVGHCMNRILTITSRLVPGAPAQFSGKPIWGENHNLVTGTGGKVGVGMGILRDCELCPLTFRSEW